MGSKTSATEACQTEGAMYLAMWNGEVPRFLWHKGGHQTVWLESLGERLPLSLLHNVAIHAVRVTA